MRLTLIIILFNYTVSTSQVITTLDDINKNPIEFANVQFYSNAKFVKGVYTNNKGEFFKNQKFQYDSIKISCIGFENKILSLKEIKPLIELKTKIYNLNEVLLVSRAKKRQKFKENKVKKAKPLTLLDGIEVAKFIRGVGQNQQLSKINFFLEKKNKKEIHLRVHFYKRDTLHNVPSTELTKENIVYVIKPNSKGKISIDISKLDIAMPMEGAFISIEALDSLLNNNFLLCTYQCSESIYSTRNYKNNVGWVDWNKWLPKNYLETFNREYNTKKLFVPDITIEMAEN